MSRKQFDLGASMYVPTTRAPSNLVAIGNGDKYPELRSVIFCTEDAVRSDELPGALVNLSRALPKLNDSEHPMRFIRVRSPSVLGHCLQMPGIENVDGFVLPKLTSSNLKPYLNELNSADRFWLMPTLETLEVFDYRKMNYLRRLLQRESRAQDRILCLRIGGNDLLNCLRVRRDPCRTIYETPVGDLISRLVGEFVPHGFGLSAPVFESIEHLDVLAEEVELDLNRGLFGKTVIHPSQIPTVERAYAVSQQDYLEAQEILRPDAPAVFARGGRMCEPTTHSRWAQDIVARQGIYGLKDHQLLRKPLEVE
jgi:citrate lyase beta subunit